MAWWPRGTAVSRGGVTAPRVAAALLAVALGVLGSGCVVRSIHPFYRHGDQAALPALDGAWKLVHRPDWADFLPPTGGWTERLDRLFAHAAARLGRREAAAGEGYPGRDEPGRATPSR